MLLADFQIRAWCIDRNGEPLDRPMIEPFSPGEDRPGMISWGLTSAGYDLRLHNDVLMFKNTYGDVINPKLFSDPEYRKRNFDPITVPDHDYIIIPPGSYMLGRSMEYLRIPRRLKGRCVGKSTYARVGIIVNTTPLEPEWEGYLTIEIGNNTPCPVAVFAAEGIAQLEFEKLEFPCQVSYADKKGKYQGQTEVTPAIVR